MFSSTFVSKTFFPEYYPNQLQIINCGLCYDWAYCAYRMFPGVQLWTTNNHAFVEVNGRFFDSETTRGVIHYKNLKCNVACGCHGSRATTLREFKSFWNNALKREWRKSHWVDLDKRIELGRR